jgi:ATP-dependent helicase/nuclease subunit B
MNRQFWDWGRPVLDWATERLMADFRGGSADFSDTLFVVPTAEAGRRLREAMAKAAARAGGGVVMPHVWAPEQLVMTRADRERCASRLKSWLAWAVVLEGIRDGECPALLGEQSLGRAWSWCLATAELMLDLSSTLGAGGWTFAAVADSDHAMADAARWRELASLEAKYWQLLQRQGSADIQQVKMQRAVQPELPAGVTRVRVLAAPDLPALAVRWLHKAEAQAQVWVHVLAPDTLAEAFDEAGRPIPVFWKDASALGTAIEPEAVLVSINSAGQAEAVVKAVGQLARQVRTAVGVCDAEVSNAVLERMSGEGVRVFEPGGIPPARTGLWHVVQSFLTVLEREPWNAVAALLRVPEVQAALNGGKSEPRLLEAADAFAALHLPLTLSHAVSLLSEGDQLLAPPLRCLLQWRVQMEFRPALDLVRGLLTWFYGEREFVTHSPADVLHLQLAEELIQAAGEVDAELQVLERDLPAAERLSLVLKLVERSALSEPRGEVDLVLQGWLELLWEQAPGLVVAGVNEESVPGILISHPFLPDGLREKLGLACQSSRYARDAYLMHALGAQRQPGAMRWICGQWSDRGDALKPSRLLLRCEDADLPARVRLLFPKEEEKRTITEPPRSLAWKLKPTLKEPRTLLTVSPSRLGSYLRCPFGYYLDYETRWGDAVDPAKQEMDNMEFGELMHRALERFARDPALRVSERVDEIAAYLDSAMVQLARERWGEPLPMLVMLQVEGARQRLRAVAESEAAARKDGWQIMDAELDLADQTAAAVMIGGARLSGVIDRVERRERAGVNEIRVLDFKTSDKATQPQDAHVRRITARKMNCSDEEWKRSLDRDGKTVHQWSSLQLPLYAAALRARGLGVPQVGYFCVPKSVQHTAVMMWDDFDEWWVDRALEIAEQVVERIHDGVFWPPLDEERAGDLPFLGDVCAAVEWPSFSP